MEQNMDLDSPIEDWGNVTLQTAGEPQNISVAMEQDANLPSAVSDRQETSKNLKHIEDLDKNLRYWQEKYTRLLEGHRKLQSINQSLEDKLLNMASTSDNDRKESLITQHRLEKDLEETKRKLSEVEKLNEMNEKNCLVAVQLLQCKQADFKTHKLSSIPADLQEKLKHLKINNNNLASETSPRSSSPSNDNGRHSPSRPIRVPIPTFPPMATMYTAGRKQEKRDSSSEDTVTAPLMGKVLEERIHELNAKQYHICDYCHINHASRTLIPKTTQTSPIGDNDPLASHQQVIENISLVALVNPSESLGAISSQPVTSQLIQTGVEDNELWSTSPYETSKVINV